MLAGWLRVHPLKSKIVSVHLHQSFLSLASGYSAKVPSSAGSMAETMAHHYQAKERVVMADMLPCLVAQGPSVSVSLCVKAMHNI